MLRWNCLQMMSSFTWILWTKSICLRKHSSKHYLPFVNGLLSFWMAIGRVLCDEFRKGQYCWPVLFWWFSTFRCRDLGMIISNDLSPSAHINDIVFKAHQRANLMFRCSVSRNASLLVRAFVTYVRPLLEYNCVVWLCISSVAQKWLNRRKGVLPKHYTDCAVILMISDSSC